MAASNNDDWRSECSDIAAMQNKAREEGKFTDIQFVMGKGDAKRVFHAHKSILACGSPVFEKMFFGSLAEKRSVIETDDDPEAFGMLQDYIYGKCNKITSLVSAWKYFTIGDKYLMSNVPDSAKKYIESVSLDENAFWDIIENGIFSSPLFDDKLQSYIMQNASNILKSKKILSVPESFVNIILQMDKLNASEYELLFYLTKWGCQNLHPATSKTFTKFYQHIRFSTLTSNEFFNYLEAFTNAIDLESSLEILQHLHNPKCRSLPKWCCTSKISRKEELQEHNWKHSVNRGYGSSEYDHVYEHYDTWG